MRSYLTRSQLNLALGRHTTHQCSDDSVFQFSDEWFALGIVSPERLGALRAEWVRGEDRSPEHYRWRAFLGFVADRRPFSAELATALYELGARDPDTHAMGASMMHSIVQMPECPENVLEAAAASGRRHLVRLVERRRANFASPGQHPGLAT